MATRTNLRGGEAGEDDFLWGRALQTDANGNILTENPTTRVGEVGVGTFILLLLVIVYIGICCFGSMMKRPGWLYCWSTFFTSIIMIFLFEAQRTDRYIQEEETVTDVDEYFNFRLFTLILMIWTSFWTW